jgi:hypothetical protein
LTFELFVYQNLSFLSFPENLLFRSSSKKGGAKESTDEQEDAKAIVPPLETFFRVESEERARHFFDTVQPQDLLLCRVTHKKQSFSRFYSISFWLWSI